MMLAISRSVFVLAAFLLPVAAIVTNKLPTALLVVLAISVLITRRPRAWRAAMPYLGVFGLLVAWAMASALWSVDPGDTLWRAFRMGLLIACGLVLCIAAWEMAPDERRRTATFACIGLATGVTIALLDGLWWQIPHTVVAGPEAQRPLLLTHLPASCVFAVLLFPAVAVLVVRRWFAAAGVLVILTAASVVLFGTTSAVVAIAVSATVFLAVRLGGAVPIHILTVCVPVVFVAMPTLIHWSDLPKRAADAGVTLDASTAHRLIVWRFTSAAAAERPFAGWGFQGSRRIPGGDAVAVAGAGFDDIFAVSRISPESEAGVMPLHPHNASLQLRLELGWVGLILFAAIYLVAFRGVLHISRDDTIRAGAAACLMAAFVVSQISFSVWQSWWVATQFWIAALVVAMFAVNEVGSEESRLGSLRDVFPWRLAKPSGSMEFFEGEKRR